MDTITKEDRDAEIRALECAEVMSRLMPVFADYLDHGDIDARKGSFHKLYQLSWEIEREQTYVPLLEDRQAWIIDAVVGVYTDVSKGRIVGKAQQREAHEHALKRIDALPRSRGPREEILNRLVRTRAEIRKGEIKTRNRGGPRETANVIVGQLRPLFFNVGVKWFDLDRLGIVVARDAMRDLYRRAEKRRAAKRSPRAMQALARVLLDAVLDAFPDYDLLTALQDAVRDVPEKQFSLDSRVRAGGVAASLDRLSS